MCPVMSGSPLEHSLEGMGVKEIHRMEVHPAGNEPHADLRRRLWSLCQLM